MPASHGPMSCPARRRPANAMNSSTSSGMLRNVSTYTPPRRCSTGFGAIRRAATSVPTTMAIANANTTIRRVTQNPASHSSRLSVRTLMRSLCGYDVASIASLSVIVGALLLARAWPTHFSQDSAQPPLLYSSRTPSTNSLNSVSPS